MTNSELFKLAHRRARETVDEVGSYPMALQLALKHYRRREALEAELEAYEEDRGRRDKVFAFVMLGVASLILITMVAML